MAVLNGNMANVHGPYGHVDRSPICGSGTSSLANGLHQFLRFSQEQPSSRIVHRMITRPYSHIGNLASGFLKQFGTPDSFQPTLPPLDRCLDLVIQDTVNGTGKKDWQSFLLFTAVMPTKYWNLRSWTKFMYILIHLCAVSVGLAQSHAAFLPAGSP